ncbi:Type 2A phosphatase-associated protein 42 [Neolecta irregularis DAH-3]|uniref:Type 2A phosphatase-associated protein 42 n=1 Tax=Neolecta irregularis (strain DAH-3) TaxID=1198029 RepID=A0A1U7LGU7_NEOID|nr:Type 2A phosphatase-associated protein 42 [Neolecta irregularis DAH-3]|eukprot:OLL21772.1 Type 2A phosphatase-associated protein 42 [Neolecta irregularis DAH-3]
MSIDDYLASEAARGNILDATTTPQPVADEDDHAQADADTYKARQWDVFTEENPRGAGHAIISALLTIEIQ